MTEIARELGDQYISFTDDGYSGLNKREHFASMAMQGLLASSIVMASCASYAKDAVKCADALLEELLK